MAPARTSGLRCCENRTRSRPIGALPSSARALLNSGVLAQVSTINAHGSPHVTVVWIETQGDEWIGGECTPNGSQCLRSVAQEAAPSGFSYPPQTAVVLVAQG